MDDVFPLTVTVPVEEWSRLNTRVRYLEAALVQAYRGQRQLKEWFSAQELMVLELRALPTTRQGLLRKAQAEKWLSRMMYGRGGERFEFHFSSLPPQAFDELLRRIMAPHAGEPVQHQAQEFSFERPVVPPRRAPLPPNAEPPWILPLMRLLRDDAQLDAEDACRILCETVPENVEPPTEQEVRAVLHRLRSMGR